LDEAEAALAQGDDTDHRKKYKNNIFSGQRALPSVRNRGEAALDMLVGGFKVFGMHFQYWMVAAALIVTLGIVIGLRRP
jgi:hypothetical protein